MKANAFQKSSVNADLTAVMAHANDRVGRESESLEERDKRDEFSVLVDKIAAKFKRDFGFDFASLIVAGAVQHKAPEAVKSAVKAEGPAKGQKEEQKDPAVNVVKMPQNNEGSKLERKDARKDSDPGKAEVKAEGAEKKVPGQEKDPVKSIKAEGGKPAASPEKPSKDLSKAVNDSAASQETEQFEPSIEAVTQVQEAVGKGEAQEAKNPAAKGKLATETSKSDPQSETPVDAELETAPASPDAPAGRPAEQAISSRAKKSPESAAAETFDTNAKLLSEIFLAAAFTPKEAVNIRSAASAGAAQGALEISGLVKDKIVSSMNNALGSQLPQNMAGSFSLKPQNAKAEPKEKVNIPQPQMFKALDRIESALKEAAKSRDGKTISLRLDPPELGTVKIDVTLREGSLHARLTADSQSVNALLREYSHDLQAALRKLGLAVDKVTVAVKGEEQFTFGGQSQENSAGSGSGGHKRGKQQESAEFEDLGGFGFAAEAVQTNDVYDHWVA